MLAGRGQALRLEQARGPSAAARAGEGAKRLGNSTFGKWHLVKYPLEVAALIFQFLKDFFVFLRNRISSINFCNLNWWRCILFQTHSSAVLNIKKNQLFILENKLFFNKTRILNYLLLVHDGFRKQINDAYTCKPIQLYAGNIYFSICTHHPGDKILWSALNSKWKYLLLLKLKFIVKK